MKIRHATPDDAPAVAAIYNHAIAYTIASFWTEPRPDSEIADEIAASDESTYPWLVAEDADTDKVIGSAWSKRWNPRTAYDITCEVTIYIAPDAQGQGVGKALYTDLFARLKMIGYRHIIGGISLPNEASVRLHESMGMKQVAMFEGIGEKFGDAIDVGYWQVSNRET
jgi:L-amino acid N-acyltransferase YncA